MDKISKGMSEAGRHPHQCCNQGDKNKGFVDKVKDLAKGATEKVKNYLHGSGAKR